MAIKRVFLIVLDSFGIGWQPDAGKFGDIGANTLASIVKSEKYFTPNMQKMGLFNIDEITCGESVAEPTGAYGKLTEKSMGKDTTIGHWEIAGIISPNPLPTYPEGFPDEIIKSFCDQTGRGILCNKPYSGTEVIEKFGEEHLRTGKLIVYTSADSVFQIAAHEEKVPLEELYRDCKIARKILSGKHGVGRVIARPFTGTPGNFVRTRNRHDFSMNPPKETMLDKLQKAGLSTYAVGKIYDIFAGKGIGHSIAMNNNEDGMNKMMDYMQEDFSGLCFVNLVDFDMVYGHRNDVDGYAEAATVFDRQLGTVLEKMNDDDVIMITADHGCDPGYPGTDHTREAVPVLIYGKQIKQNKNLGVRSTFADISATILDMFNVTTSETGDSFWEQIKR